LEGKTSVEIDLGYEKNIESIDRLKQNLGYEQYLIDNKGVRNLMSEERYEFVVMNLQASAFDDYNNLNQPLLILLGDKDLNVDINETKESLTKLFRHRSNAQITIIADATHSLLKAKTFNQQSPGLRFWLKLMWAGESALAPGLPIALNEWIHQLKTI